MDRDSLQGNSCDCEESFTELGKKPKEREKPLPRSVLFLSLGVRPLSRRPSPSTNHPEQEEPFSTVSCRMRWARQEERGGRSVYEWECEVCAHRAHPRLHGGGARLSCERCSHPRAWVHQVKPLAPLVSDDRAHISVQKMPVLEGAPRSPCSEF